MDFGIGLMFGGIDTKFQITSGHLEIHSTSAALPEIGLQAE